jgi:hypothetical protein
MGLFEVADCVCEKQTLLLGLIVLSQLKPQDTPVGVEDMASIRARRELQQAFGILEVLLGVLEFLKPSTGEASHQIEPDESGLLAKAGGQVEFGEFGTGIIRPQVTNRKEIPCPKVIVLLLQGITESTDSLDHVPPFIVLIP